MKKRRYALVDPEIEAHKREQGKPVRVARYPGGVEYRVFRVQSKPHVYFVQFWSPRTRRTPTISPDMSWEEIDLSISGHYTEYGKYAARYTKSGRRG